MTLYFPNSFSTSIQKVINLMLLSLTPSLTLNVLTYPLILGIIKTNGLIPLSNFIPIKYLELVFVLTNFEITILSTLSSQILTGFLKNKTFLFYISLRISKLLYYEQKFAFIF